MDVALAPVRQPAKVHIPVLAPDVSAIAAFKSIAATLVAQMQANRLGVIEGNDPEYLHQMRVAVRRLRSLCAAYAKILPRTALQPLVADLKWLARALGPARDADVFVRKIWPPLRAVLSTNPLRAQLDAWWAKLRHRAAAKARHALSARRYQRFMRGVERQLAADDWRADASARQLAALDGEARDFACRVIERRDAKVRGHGHTLTRLDGAQLHALRIRIKKLRYAADSFGSLFERAAVRDMLRPLSRLQDVLGAINDIRVAEQQMAVAFACRRGRAKSALGASDAKGAVGTALAAWREARTAVLRRKLRTAWRAYRRARKFW